MEVDREFEIATDEFARLNPRRWHVYKSRDKTSTDPWKINRGFRFRGAYKTQEAAIRQTHVLARGEI